MKNILILLATWSTLAILAAAAHAAAPKAVTARIPVIAGTYTPPNGVDWGCGVDKPITIRADKSRICPINQKHK